MKKLFLSLILFSSALSSSFAYSAVSLLDDTKEQKIVVNNRILAKVNGKPISVIDVMKKMDMLFYRQFPEYTSSVEARHQFYTVNWKYILDELVNKELIIADAEESKMEVSPGDVRQEIEQSFGPNIHGNLDKISMTYDEASRMVQGDLMLRRIMFVRVNAKAMRQLTPFMIKEAYDEFAKNNIRPDEWVYRLVTVRDRSGPKAAEAANQAHTLLTQENVNVSEILPQLKELVKLEPSTTLTVSEEFRVSDKDLAPAYKSILAQLKPGTFSGALAQKSRDSQKAFRIFYLKELNKGGPIPFSEVEAKLKEQLLEELMAKEAEAYLTRLRQHFDVQQVELQDGFEPFILQ